MGETAARETIAISADHAGFELKEYLRAELARAGWTIEDLGAYVIEPLDGYPEYGGKLAAAVAAGRFRRGITICGTGIGASIAANRHQGVRAALCTSPEMARMAKLHNDANVLVLGGRTTPPDLALRITEAWLNSGFEGGRHEKRITDLDRLPGPIGHG